MFGYVTPDRLNMYMKDYTVYRAFYCGICKSTGKLLGQLMRITTNYDITFFSILLHNILGNSFELRNEACILNPIRKRSIVKCNPIIKQAVWLNALLMDFKLMDDILDGNKFLARVIRFMALSKIKKARRALPEISLRIDRARIIQNEVERANTASIDMAAHPFADMIRDIFRIMCKDKFTDSIANLTYQLGRFIYIIDALDDISEDKKKRRFNPFLLSYPEAGSREELLTLKRDEIEFILNSAYSEIKSSYRMMDFQMCEGVVTNILWYGMDSTINRILHGEKDVK